MNSAAMINACFRHQHPEAYGDVEVTEPQVPAVLRYGQERLPSCSGECLAEEALGYPGAAFLTS
ncbi:MAG TPA: hypothetical protein VJX92_27290 [Methylomirabilota bacterium]|nr:hypothetical protein [Methylomirabilota bacterium]